MVHMIQMKALFQEYFKEINICSSQILMDTGFEATAFKTCHHRGKIEMLKTLFSGTYNKYWKRNLMTSKKGKE